jgi:alkylresorcinol/alkylpyrone synthase
MSDDVAQLAARGPRLLALATAVPPYALRQEEVRQRARAMFGTRNELERLIPVFDNAGIETRYSCVPIDWYYEAHGWTERTQRYLDNADELIERVARRCLEAAQLGAEAIDAIVVVSTTGIATPSLDAWLLERLPFRRDVARLPIFGLGCAGGVLGLARAASLATAMPGSRILCLVVELCALAFRKDDFSPSNIVATALFGDGAAGVILASDGDGDAGGGGPRIGASGEHTFPRSLDVMGWDVTEEGLRAIFSRDIPSLVQREFGRVARAFLARHGLGLGDIARFVCHPGGIKVLNALEEVFELPPGALADARAVLRDYGNMSAATVLFVLERALREAPRGRKLLTALGPGFTAGFLLLECG